VQGKSPDAGGEGEAAMEGRAQLSNPVRSAGQVSIASHIPVCLFQVHVSPLLCIRTLNPCPKGGGVLKVQGSMLFVAPQPGASDTDDRTPGSRSILHALRKA